MIDWGLTKKVSPQFLFDKPFFFQYYDYIKIESIEIPGN